MKLEAQSRKEYFAAAGEREPLLRKLDGIIRRAAPDLKPFFLNQSSMTMLGYGPYHYKYASGREGDGAVIGLAAQKNNVSLYISVGKDGRYLPEIHGKRLGKVNCGKSCIRFKKIEDLDLGVVEEICREAGGLSKSQSHLQM